MNASRNFRARRSKSGYVKTPYLQAQRWILAPAYGGCINPYFEITSIPEIRESDVKVTLAFYFNEERGSMQCGQREVLYPLRCKFYSRFLVRWTRQVSSLDFGFIFDGFLPKKSVFCRESIYAAREKIINSRISTDLDTRLCKRLERKVIRQNC